jgi:ubiquinone biosynthesis protein UbiJ
VSERAIAPDRAQVDGWAAAVDRTRDDVERLAARISRIEAGLRKG